MKALWAIVLILLIFQGLVHGTGLFPVTPIELCPTSKIIQNGSAPYLQKFILEEGRAPKLNLMEELEQKLIETRLIQLSV